jgi:hypothetical protein
MANYINYLLVKVQLPPDAPYHKPPPKRNTMVLYGFGKPPSQTRKHVEREGVNTSVFNEAPALMSPVQKTALELTVNLSMKMGLQDEHGLLVVAKSLGGSSKKPYGTRLIKPYLLISLKSHFKALHRDQKSNYHDSACFQAVPQKIKRNQKVTYITAPRVDSATSTTKRIKRFRKKIPDPVKMGDVTFKNRGFFLNKEGMLICNCDKK